MIFTTQSGSQYEVRGNQIRRVNGLYPAHHSVGPDGQWKTFTKISPILVGTEVLIEFPGARSRTITTKVAYVDAGL